MSYIFISHDLSVVRHISNYVGVMYLGKLVETGSSASIYDNPAHPYTRGLLDSVPIADPERERRKKSGGVSGERPSALSPPSGCRFRTRCPRAQEICGQVEPVLRNFPEMGHQAACHFPLQRPLED